LQSPDTHIVHVRELPGNISSSARRKRTAQALIADAVDEKQVDSIVGTPSFKHLINYVSRHREPRSSVPMNVEASIPIAAVHAIGS
jgi:hypothetical protein